MVARELSKPTATVRRGVGTATPPHKCLVHVRYQPDPLCSILIDWGATQPVRCVRRVHMTANAWLSCRHGRLTIGDVPPAWKRKSAGWVFEDHGCSRPKGAVRAGVFASACAGAGVRFLESDSKQAERGRLCFYVLCHRSLSLKKYAKTLIGAREQILGDLRAFVMAESDGTPPDAAIRKSHAPPHTASTPRHVTPRHTFVHDARLDYAVHTIVDMCASVHRTGWPAATPEKCVGVCRGGHSCLATQQVA